MRIRLLPVFKTLRRSICIHQYNGVRKGDIVHMNERLAYYQCEICGHKTIKVEIQNFKH